MTHKIHGNIAKSIAKVLYSFFFHQTAWSVLTLTMVSTWNDQHSVYDPIVLVGFSLITLKSNGTTRSRTVVSFGHCFLILSVNTAHLLWYKVSTEVDKESTVTVTYSTYKVIKLYILMAGSGMSVICMDLHFVLHSYIA